MAMLKSHVTLPHFDMVIFYSAVTVMLILSANNYVKVIDETHGMADEGMSTFSWDYTSFCFELNSCGVQL